MSFFGCVVADPPWQYKNTASRAAAEDHYPTMSTRQIMRLPVEDWVAKNAHLYCWCTDSHLPDALRVIEAWGFDYKMTLVWVKTTQDGNLAIGMGNYFRHAHELCLFATRGKTPAAVHNLPSVFWAPRGEHSAKPEILQDWAEQLSPGPRLEMFSRRARAGWAAWGDQANGIDTDPALGGVARIAC